MYGEGGVEGELVVSQSEYILCFTAHHTTDLRNTYSIFGYTTKNQQKTNTKQWFKGPFRLHREGGGVIDFVTRH